MSEPLICKICGHDADYHRFAVPDPRCAKCPGRICQDGPDGRRYRAARVGGGE